jgi:histidyl-tRNA synthetase
MPSHSTLPGFRDFYPQDFAVRAHIMRAWREVSLRYGFEEYDGPPLESLDLYTEKSGEEIVRQLYNFEDKGGRAVAMRPEMTPTLARMVGARAGSLRKPVRWFAMPQLFRYERTQRGRLREHFQWNVDILGEEDIAADVEVLAVALDALRVLGLREADIVARFNDRRLLEALLTSTGVAPDRLIAAYAVIDKIGREPAERTRERLRSEAGLQEGEAARLLELFATAAAGALAARGEAAQAAMQRLRQLYGADGAGAGADTAATADTADTASMLGLLRELHGGNEAVARELDRLDEYERRLSEMGFGGFIRFDPSIVRGLAYYTGTVFEIFDRSGELRAVCGGGRYDRLLASVGGADLPGVGFGMGDVVLGELLRDRGLLPDGRQSVDVFLVTMSEAERPLLLEIAQLLRGAGRSVLYAFRPGGVGRQLKEADARGARHVVILGPDEVQRGMATVRSMDTGGQAEVALDRLLRDPAAVLQ